MKETDEKTEKWVTEISTENSKKLVIEEKAIYSIEKFLMARRLMYWQVYLHKSVVSAENVLINSLKRANELSGGKKKLFATPSFALFLENDFTSQDFVNKPHLLEKFAQLDDYDVMASVKAWTENEDFISVATKKKPEEHFLLKVVS